MPDQPPSGSDPEGPDSQDWDGPQGQPPQPGPWGQPSQPQPGPGQPPPGHPQGQPQWGQPPQAPAPQGPPPWGQPEPTQVFGQPPYAGGQGQPPYPGATAWQPGGGFGPEPPKKSHTGLIIAAIVAALVLLVGGIAAFALVAGDDNKKADPGTQVTPTTSPMQSPSTPDESTGASGDDAKYCATMDKFEKQFMNTTDMSDADIDSFVRTLSEVAPVAPAEIQDEVVHVRDVFAALQSTLKDIGLTFPEVKMPEKVQALNTEDRKKLIAVSTKLTDPSFQADASAIDQDWATRC